MIDPYRIAVAFLVTVLMTIILEHLAPRFGMVDHPGGRKHHARVIPLAGGVAIFIGFVVSSIDDKSILSAIWPMTAMALILILGVIDDIYEISARYKLLGQLVVATFLVLISNTVIESFGNLVGTGDLRPGMLGVPLTVFCLVGLVNALNMIDGLDGLAGGLSLVSAVALAIAASISGQTQPSAILAMLAASIVGFLVFNLRFPWQRHARVFLGDAGSNLLGLVLAYFAVLITQSPDSCQDALPPMCAVWLIGLPILDTITVMMRRLADGSSPFSAGRDHLHHLLQRMGLSHTATLWSMLTTAVMLAACGLAGWRLHAPDWLMLWSAVGILILYYLWTRRIMRTVDKLAH